MDTRKLTANNDGPDKKVVIDKNPFMKPFLLVCCPLLLLSACSKTSAIHSRMIGNWKLVAYTQAYPHQVVHPPADSLVFLSLQFNRYEMIAKNILQSSGDYRITAPNNNSPYYYINFGHSVASEIDFRQDTMVLTVMMTTAYEPNECQYVKN
jgi:hypothetical protein